VNRAPVSLEASERKVILLLGLLAAIHVFVFSAAFPFFNDVDEQLHLDLVVRYSQADIPRALTPPALESLRYIALFATPEYLWPPQTFPGGRIDPPPWTLPMKDVRDVLLGREKIWKDKVKNDEASQPPLYYSVAGTWWRLCSLAGFQGGDLLYTLRFFNILPVIALLWLGWRAARRVFPENDFIHIVVPAFIAFMPQTTFYSINNDVLAPVLFGIVFILLLKFWEAEVPDTRLAFGLGLALAGTFLTKISNLPLLVVAGIFIGCKTRKLSRQDRLSAAFPSLVTTVISATLPMVAWMAWCKMNFGDFTGSILKIQFLGWTNKPFAQWFHHPIFTLKGLWIFVSGNLSTFWQGELLWQRKPLSIPGVDRFYVLLTLGLFFIALIALLNRRSALSHQQRVAMVFGFACLLAMFAFFALLSVKYDFQDCFYPSREHPFFTSGRLMLGMLIPFLLLFTLGLDRLLGKTSESVKYTVLVVLLLFMLGSEITVDWRIFPNVYNWYHM
jgi:hypothetical protein